MTCPNCSTQNSAHALYCFNCGAELASMGGLAMGGLSGAGLLGVLAGIFLWLLIAWAATAMSQVNFTPWLGGMRRTGALFLLISLVADIAALVFFSRRPVRRHRDALLRSFAVAAAWVLLGGLGLCNVFSLPSLA